LQRREEALSIQELVESMAAPGADVDALVKECCALCDREADYCVCKNEEMDIIADTVTKANQATRH